jgi:hypothetical protein
MGTQNGVVAEIDGAPSSWESQNVRYRIVTDGGRGRIILDDIDMLIRHVVPDRSVKNGCVSTDDWIFQRFGDAWSSMSSEAISDAMKCSLSR